MATKRSLVFTNEYVYHVFNRGIESRTIFTDQREYVRFLNTVEYYHYASTPLSYSKFLLQTIQNRNKILENLLSTKMHITLLAYCLLPNHFHFLIRQNIDNGISTFVSNISDSYTRFFNIKHDREGPLFQGTFKAVFIEDEDQLIHVSRYIHINPVISSKTSIQNLSSYQWSSYPAYIQHIDENRVDTSIILSQFSSKQSYESFVLDQVGYAKELDKVKHLTLEE